ncbi:MAG TPA: hypothetical protein VNG33_24555, partial [Polyangiaceae bacterium]|nr:hypothetical protein [Polyangiaceae bacterium]
LTVPPSVSGVAVFNQGAPSFSPVTSNTQYVGTLPGGAAGGGLPEGAGAGGVAEGALTGT